MQSPNIYLLFNKIVLNILSRFDIALGEQCNNAAQCYVKKGPTRCLKMKCQCEENFFPSADKQECNGVIRTGI